MQCDHTDEIGTVNALLVCPEFALKVTGSSLPRSLGVPAFFSLSERAWSDWPEHGEDRVLENKGACSNVDR